MKSTAFLAVMTLAAWAANSNAQAHTVGWSVDAESSALVLQFSYAGNDPMSFAEVTVTAPDGRVFQQARADRAGKFAFVPSVTDENGAVADWKVVARDSEGHEMEATVTLASTENVTAVKRTVTGAMGWIAGASLLANIVVAGMFFEHRARRANPAATG